MGERPGQEAGGRQRKEAERFIGLGRLSIHSLALSFIHSFMHACMHQLPRRHPEGVARAVSHPESMIHTRGPFLPVSTLCTRFGMRQRKNPTGEMSSTILTLSRCLQNVGSASLPPFVCHSDLH